MDKFDLQERLINFSVEVINLTDKLPDIFACNHLGRQLIRSGTSTALNYGESQAAESRADFIHKLKIVLKELRESYVCLQILNKRAYLPQQDLQSLLSECNELISIFVSSLKTAQQNNKK
ncbi:MAG: four helix bundle protein [Bacteroidia bacterium]